jgi:hypothetical protein
MTTSIDTLKEQLSNDSDFDDDCENICEVIMDLSRSVNTRVKALENYYASEGIGDNAVEIISTLAGMYQISGSKLIEQFFYNLCTNGKISSFLKLEAAKSLLDYSEVEEGSDSDEDTDEREARIERDQAVQKRNIKRKNIAFQALNCVCSDLVTMPTPCRVEAICRLMESEEFYHNADNYFRDYVSDDNVDCEFRYKTILSLENISAKLIKEELDPLFLDKEFVNKFYTYLEQILDKLFPKIKPKKDSYKFWKEVLFQLSYDDIRSFFKHKFPDKSCGLDFFISSAQLTFLLHPTNIVYYRTLAGQYLLQKCNDLTDCQKSKVEQELLKFALNTELDYDRRADAADVLLRLGSTDMKQYGRDIIMELGRIDGEARTVFDNAQNVHTREVEDSVIEVLEFLSTLQTSKVNDKVIDFGYVNNQIENMLNEERKSLFIERSQNTEICDHCKSYISEKIYNDNKKYCSNTCLNFSIRDNKIRLALNRIYMDRVLYSKFNSSLVNILLKIWSYLTSHKNEQEMRKRLLEELEEMSGTCSSGFATRLINVISGFGDFSIRISYEDQIIANFTGRLNAAARNITSIDSVFRNKYLKDLVELWLYDENNEKILSNIKNRLKSPTRKEVIEEYLIENKQEKVEECITDFADAVLNEMTMSSSGYANRQNFSLFFRTYVSLIREELAEEFKDLIDSTDFDLYFRRSIMSYEGEL